MSCYKLKQLKGTKKPLKNTLVVLKKSEYIIQKITSI